MELLLCCGPQFLHEVRDGFYEDVGFDVHGCFRLSEAERGEVDGGWYECEFEVVIVDFCQCHGDSIYGYRSFGYHVLHEFFRWLDGESYFVGGLESFDDFAGAVDMPLHDVSAEEGLRCYARFEVDGVAGFEESECGAAE